MTYWESKEILKSKTSLRESVIRLINECLDQKATTIRIKLVGNLKELLQKEVIQEVLGDDSVVKINEFSFLLQGVLKELAENKLEEEIPVDIIQSLVFVNKFGDEIRKPELNVHWSGYGTLIKGLEKYILLHLFFDHDIDILAFFKELPEDYADRKHKVLYSFERNFFEVLPYLGLSTSSLFDFIIELSAMEKTVDGVMDFARSYPAIFPKKGLELLDYGLNRDILEVENLCFSLLVGLHKGNPRLAQEKTKEIFVINQREALTAAARFNYISEKEVVVLFNLVEEANLENTKVLIQYPYFYMRIINSEKTSDDIRRKSFKKLKDLFEYGDSNFKNTLIFDVSRIEGHDEEKYKLLLIGFNNGLDLNVAKRFFYNFKNPKFFFHLFKSVFHQVGIKLNMDLFKDGLWSLWKNNKKGTEKEILNLMTDDNALLRYGGVKLLTLGHKPLPVNLNLIKTAKNQCNAIDGLLDYPIMLEELLGLSLQLRLSRFVGVNKKLRNKLCELVDAYPYHLVGYIEDAIKGEEPSKIDDFLLPIKNRVEEYRLLMEKRSKIKELDPYENELEFLEYYFTLEREKNQEMMSGISESKNSLSVLFKKSIIVRGIAFKPEDEDEIFPLAKISHSMPIDQRAYKNPDLYQINFEGFISGTPNTHEE